MARSCAVLAGLVVLCALSGCAGPQAQRPSISARWSGRGPYSGPAAPRMLESIATRRVEQDEASFDALTLQKAAVAAMERCEKANAASAPEPGFGQVVLYRYAPPEEGLPAREVFTIAPAPRTGEPAVDFPDGLPTATVKILADTPGTRMCGWQYTGVYMEQGDELFIKADGYCAYHSGTAYSPDGRTSPYSEDLVPQVAFGALVGRVFGSLMDDGRDPSGKGLYGPGFVGSQFHAVINGRTWGHLSLGCNDSSDGDNYGYFTVDIWVVRDGEIVRLPEE